MLRELKSTVGPDRNDSGRLLRFAALAAALTISVLIIVFRDAIAELSGLGYLGLFLLSAIGNATVIFPAPAFLTAVAGGSALDPLAVGVLVGTGATLGELTAYVAGFSGRAFVDAHSRLARITGWVRDRAVITLFFLALIPNPFFDVAGIAAGASRIPIHRFLLATWAGKLIKFLVLAYIGSSSVNALSNLLAG